MTNEEACKELVELILKENNATISTHRLTYFIKALNAGVTNSAALTIAKSCTYSLKEVSICP